MAITQGMPTQNGQVAESSLELSYTPPDTTADPDFNKNALDVINDIAAEFEAGQFAGPDEDVAEVDTEAKTEARVEPEVKSEKSEEPEEDDLDPKFVRGFERLTARENKARAAEAAAEAREVAARKAEADFASLKGLKATKDLLSELDTDPYEALKSQGKDPDHLIRVLMARSCEVNGQEVPDGLKKYLEGSPDKRRIAALEKKIEMQERVAQANSYYKEKETAAREYVQKVDVKKYSTVADALKADADFVQREVWEEIVRDAQVKAAQDPDGDPMSPEQAVANVEARWTKLKTLFGVAGPSTTTGKQIGKTGAMNPPQTKPAPRPIAPWLQKQPNDIYEDGIQEALREFNRVEQERKVRR